jgi:dUTP pyrophosphatase
MTNNMQRVGQFVGYTSTGQEVYEYNPPVLLPDPAIEIFRAHKDAKLPAKGTPDSAAWDLYSIDAGEIYPGETKIFSTGLILRPPAGYHIKVWGRSGFGMKYGVGIPHGVGTVDYDFAGPDDVMRVVLHRTCSATIHKEFYDPLKIEVGERIAQMTVEKTNIFTFKELDHPPKELSRGGWGSTGRK